MENNFRGELAQPFSSDNPFPKWDNNNFTIDYALLAKSEAYYLYDGHCLIAYIIYEHDDYSNTHSFQRLSECVKGAVFIRALQVHHNYLRRGIASQMLEKVFELFPNYVYTLIAVNDIKAKLLYTKHGFHWWSQHYFGPLLIKSSVSLAQVYTKIYPYVWPIGLSATESNEQRVASTQVIDADTRAYYEKEIKFIQGLFATISII